LRVVPRVAKAKTAMGRQQGIGRDIREGKWPNTRIDEARAQVDFGGKREIDQREGQIVGERNHVKRDACVALSTFVNSVGLQLKDERGPVKPAWGGLGEKRTQQRGVSGEHWGQFENI